MLTLYISSSKVTLYFGPHSETEESAAVMQLPLPLAV